MKRLFASVLAGSVFFGAAASAADIRIDGVPLVTDTEPVIVSDRVLMPMRAVFEALSAEVDWIGSEQIISAAAGSRLILFKIGSSRLIVQDAGSGSLEITELDAAPALINDRTMIPVRAAAEALGAYVDWDPETETVIIETDRTAATN